MSPPTRQASEGGLWTRTYKRALSVVNPTSKRVRYRVPPAFASARDLFPNANHTLRAGVLDLEPLNATVLLL